MVPGHDPFTSGEAVLDVTIVAVALPWAAPLTTVREAPVLPEGPERLNVTSAWQRGLSAGDRVMGSGLAPLPTSVTSSGTETVVLVRPDCPLPVRPVKQAG